MIIPKPEKKIIQENEFGENQEIVITKRILPYRIFMAKIKSMEFSAHTAIEIIYVVEGRLEIELKDNTQILNKGDFYIVDSNKAHCIKQCQKDNIVLCFQIESNYLEKKLNLIGNYTFSNERNNIYINKIIEHALGSLYIESLNYKNVFDNKYKEIDFLVEAIKPFIVFNEPLDQLDINNTAKYIVYDIAEKYCNISFCENISLSIVAKQYNLSYSYLSRIFKIVTGINFTEYFNKKKLNKVIDLLLNTNKTITEIASLSEFSNVKVLNKQFLKALLISPSKFRKKYKDEKNEQIDRLFFEDNSVKSFIKKINNFKLHESKRNLENSIYNLSMGAYDEADTKTSGKSVDLNCLIDGDISNLDFSLKQFNFENIIIKLKFTNGEFLMETKDRVFKKMQNSEIDKIVRDLDNNNTIPMIQIEFISYNKESFYKNEDPFDKKTCNDIKKTLDSISMIIGRHKLSTWKFELYIPEIDKLVIKKSTFSIINNQINVFANMLESKFGKDYINWGIYIGKLEISKENQDINYMKHFRKLSKNPGFYRMDLLYYHCDLYDENKFIFLEKNLNTLVINAQDNLGIQSNAINKKLIGEFNYIVDNVDLSKSYNMIYYNLCLNIAMLNVKQNKFYISKFKVIEVEKQGSLIQDSLYNELGVKTTLRYIYKFISKLNSNLVDNKNGYLATRDGENLAILLYSHYTECYKSMDNFDVLDYNNINKKIMLNVDGLKGNYKISEYNINSKNSTFYQKFMDNIGTQSITGEEKAYIQSRSMPDMKVKVVNGDHSIKYATELKPLDISLILIKPV